MSPLLHIALNSFGIQRQLPRTLVYGSLCSRGLGIHDPFWTQLIQYLQAILCHTHHDTPTSMLLDKNMDLVQHHVGSEITFGDLPFNDLTPSGWIKHTSLTHPFSYLMPLSCSSVSPP